MKKCMWKWQPHIDNGPLNCSRHKKLFWFGVRGEGEVMQSQRSIVALVMALERVETKKEEEEKWKDSLLKVENFLRKILIVIGCGWTQNSARLFRCCCKFSRFSFLFFQEWIYEEISIICNRQLIFLLALLCFCLLEVLYIFSNFIYLWFRWDLHAGTRLIVQAFDFLSRILSSLCIKSEKWKISISKKNSIAQSTLYTIEICIPSYVNDALTKQSEFKAQSKNYCLIFHPLALKNYSTFSQWNSNQLTS